MTKNDEDRRGDAPLATEVQRASGAVSARGFFWLHLLTFLAFLSLWTWKLLEPAPVPEELARRLSSETKFAAAKGLHAGGYAFLTLLAVTLPVPNRWRWYLVAFLAFHGVAGEVGQTFVPNRTGTVRDVLIDWLGIALGVLTWQLWSPGQKRTPEAR